MCIICHSNIILATYGAMLTLCLFHIKLKRMSRFGDNICVRIKITLKCYVVSHENIHFPGDICLTPWTVKIYWLHCESSSSLRYRFSLTMKSHIIGNPWITEFVWLWTMQMERKYEVVCFKNSSKIIRLRADLQMTRMPKVCLSEFS